METKIYYDNDANIEILKDKVISIIGYGNQGRSQALNLRDSGIENVIVGSIRDASFHQAEDDGFKVYPMDEAIRMSDIIFMLIPDEVASDIYEEVFKPNLKDGAAINFSSAYNITFKNIIPAENLDIIMVAPRMIGEGVRELYEAGEGFPTFVSVEQDYTGKAKEIAVALAKALGSTKQGAIEVTFNDETYLDLMAEQGIWPIIYNIFIEAYKLEIEKGHPSEAVLTEMFMSHEPEVMMRKAAEMGLFKQLPLHSRTSQYGQLRSFGKFDSSSIRSFLEERYQEIEDGTFNKEWLMELDNKLVNFEEMREAAYNNEISLSEEEYRKRLK